MSAFTLIVSMTKHLPFSIVFSQSFTSFSSVHVCILFHVSSICFHFKLQSICWVLWFCAPLCVFCEYFLCLLVVSSAVLFFIFSIYLKIFRRQMKIYKGYEVALLLTDILCGSAMISSYFLITTNFVFLHFQSLLVLIQVFGFQFPQL